MHSTSSSTSETLLPLNISILAASLPDLAPQPVRLAAASAGPSKSQPKRQRPWASPATCSALLAQASLTRQRAAALWRPAGGCICMCPALAADPGLSLLCSLWLPQTVPQHGDVQLNLGRSQAGAAGRPAVSHQRCCKSRRLWLPLFVCFITG